MNARVDERAERLIGFSARLRQLLTQRGHSLVPAQLAREFQFSTKEQRATAQTFSNWLNGVQLPRGSTLDALAGWLRVTADYLVDGVPVLHSAPIKPADADSQLLLDHFAKLDAYGRRVALTMIAGLARLEARMV